MLKYSSSFISNTHTSDGLMICFLKVAFVIKWFFENPRMRLKFCCNGGLKKKSFSFVCLKVLHDCFSYIVHTVLHGETKFFSASYGPVGPVLKELWRYGSIIFNTAKLNTRFILCIFYHTRHAKSFSQGVSLKTIWGKMNLRRNPSLMMMPVVKSGDEKVKIIVFQEWIYVIVFILFYALYIESTEEYLVTALQHCW